MYYHDNFLIKYQEVSRSKKDLQTTYLNHSRKVVVRRNILAILTSRIYYAMLSNFIGVTGAAFYVAIPEVRQSIIESSLNIAMNYSKRMIDVPGNAYMLDTAMYWVCVYAVTLSIQVVFSTLFGSSLSTFTTKNEVTYVPVKSRSKNRTKSRKR